MALSQTRLYNCWQLTNKESGHCQPSPPPPSFFLLLRSVGIYIYTFLSQRLGRWAMCLVLYIYNRPLHHHHHHQPSLNSNIDLPSRRRGPETPCVHPSLQRGKMRSTYTQREKSGRFETSKVCAASTFFFVLFCRRWEDKKLNENARLRLIFCFSSTPFNPKRRTNALSPIVCVGARNFGSNEHVNR